MVCNVSSPSFSPFVRLCKGEFGAKPTGANHLLVVVNGSWTTGKAVGQLWERCDGWKAGRGREAGAISARACFLAESFFV